MSGDASWADAHFGAARAMAEYLRLLLDHAQTHPFSDDPLVRGLLYGPPEHDLATETAVYFNINTWTWRELSPTGTPPTKRKGHAACLLLNSLLAVFGGGNPEVPAVHAEPGWPSPPP